MANKLKTLNDLGVCGCCEVEDQQEYGCMKPELREEAIKWLKELKRVGELHSKDNFCKEKVGELELCLYDYEEDEFTPVKKFIKHFFEITEEDLIKDANVSGDEQ